MSAILLSNPFVAQTSPNTMAVTAVPKPITPAQNTAAAQNDGNATSFAGSSGNSKQVENAELMNMRKGPVTTLNDAEPRSIITAQAVPEPAKIVLPTPLPEVEMPDPLPTYAILKMD